MLKILAVSLFSLGLAGCATAPTLVRPGAPLLQTMPGTYHRVAKGQTLWKISRIYGVDIDELARLNRITDTTAIEVGQQIFVPGLLRPQAQTAKYSDNDDFIWPLSGRVSASFGQSLNNMVNKGINIEPRSSLNIAASRSGRVVFVGEDFAGFGKTIIIEHNDGIFTVYSRNAEVFVKAGEGVQKGAIIAKAGASGRDRRTYLHFEVRKGHIAQNPLFYLP